MENVAIVLQGSQAGTYTSETGQFDFTGIYEGSYILQISHAGYQRKQIPVSVTPGSPVHQYIALVPRKYHLKPLIVTGQSDQPGTILLNRESIRKSNTHSLNQLLEQFSGVTFANATGAGHQSVRIRGSTTNQVLVLFDGIPLNDPLTGEVNLENIPTANIDHVTITPHGASAEYGAGAFSGVIKIFSQSHPLNKGMLGFTLGSFGERSIRPSINGEFGKWNYSLNLQDRFIQRNYPYTFQLPDGTRVSRQRENADLTQQSAQSSLEYDGQKRLFSLRAHYLQTERGLPGKVYFWTPNARSSEDRFGISGQYAQQYLQSSLQFQINAAKTRSHYVNKPSREQPLIPAYNTAYAHSTFHSKLEYQVHQSERLTWKIDTQGQYTGFHQNGSSTEFSDPIRAAQQQLSAGGSIHYVLPQFIRNWQISLQPIVRLSGVTLTNQHHTESYPFLSRSILVAFNSSQASSLQLYLREDWAFRPPTFGDLFYQDFRVSGNPDLKPEKSNEFTIGASISATGAFSGTLQLESYWKQVTDQIYWTTGSYANFTPQNTDSKIIGQSMQFHWKAFSKRVFGHIFSEHLIARNLGGNPATRNKLLTYRPQWQFQTSIGLKWSILTIEYFHRFRGKQFTTAANTKSLPGFNVADLNIDMEWHPGGTFKSLEIRPALRMNNLWNKKYEVVARMPEPGRNFQISLNFIYKPNN